MKRIHSRYQPLSHWRNLAIGAALILGLLSLVYAQKGAVRSPLSVIPKPLKIQMTSGVFRIEPGIQVRISTKDPAALAIGEELAARLRLVTGYPVEPPSGPAKAARGIIHLKLSPALFRLGDEGYLLSSSKKTILIEAFKPAGLFYGVQTLYQLLPPEVEGSAAASGVDWMVPRVAIEDMPRFTWRGVHLDVGRHFFPKEFIKKYIDYLAMYKMNTFHWHLTEDQGWRIEIKKYPQLTQAGAWRRETMYDGEPYGGFYTQDEVREIVDYARKKFITVVPEIEMPGHCQSALAAYPELSCSGGPFKVGTEWGIIHDVYCAGSEKTFEFLQDVLTEVFDLFPSAFIHIGGDEAPKTRWQNCVRCQARIKVEGLADEKELQSYFIKRIEKFINAQGRRLVGWDEILEGGLAPNAAVMSWRGIAGGIEAAKAGHDVIMTPTSHCYFDYYQGKVDEPVTIGGYLPVDKVYSYEPVPADLTPDEAKHILGAQANIWTEYMSEPAQVEYMLLPRLLALSEVVWTKKALRDYQDFSQRLVPQYDRLAAKGAGFRLPPPDGLGGQQVVTGPVAVTVSPPFPQAEVRFTLDGSEPTISSPLLLQPTIQVEKSALIQARTFLRSGRMSRTTSTSVSIVDPEQNGLEYGYYEGVWYKLPDFTGLAPVRTGRALSLSLDIDESRSQTFGLAFKGFIQIPNSGDYTFSLQTEAGGLISIAGQEIVRNDGLFRIREVSGRVRLEAGKWPLLVTYFKKSSGRQLRIFIEGPGSVRQILPAHWLYLK